ncbi:MAG: hypothetical protein U9Q30_08630 [Campylobacterota bacterium]|nr:hypothetical protein [Campylobacterota bacterium]
MIYLKNKLLYILIFQLTLFATPPNWYINNDIPYLDYELIGYGEGATQQEAKRVARNDISTTLSVKTKSNLDIKKISSNNYYSKDIQQNINEKSSIDLRDLVVLKSGFFDGKYYVALKYINLPFSKRVRLGFENIDNIKQENNKYLLKTLLLQELKDEFGFYPKIKIYRDNLVIDNKSFRIDDELLKKLFISTSSEYLQVNQPNIIKNGEFFFINIKVAKSGYLSLIQIEQNGATSVFFANKKVIKDIELEYPNRDDFEGIEGYLKDGVDKVNDLNIAILCQEKKDFSYFDYLSYKKENFAKVYGDFFHKINNCDITTKRITILR